MHPFKKTRNHSRKKRTCSRKKELVQEKKNLCKNKRTRPRKHALELDIDTSNPRKRSRKKVFPFFPGRFLSREHVFLRELYFSWTSSFFLERVRVFLCSYFPVFFYKFQAQAVLDHDTSVTITGFERGNEEELVHRDASYSVSTKNNHRKKLE